MNYDNLLDKIFFQNNSLNLKYLTKFKYWKKFKKYICINNYLDTRFNDSLSLRETLYRIHYHIYDKPKCPVCGTPLLFHGRQGKIFLSHCSNICKRKDKNVQNKWKETCITKYNGDITNRSKYKQTCLDKYNVTNSFAIPEISQKIHEKNQKNIKIIIQKMKKTNQEKYGVSFYLQTDEFKEKKKQTSLIKYGTEYPIQSSIVLDKYDRAKLEEKRQNTLQQNNSYNQSLPENKSYILLKEKFPNIIRQYKSDKYPFRCDFYIPDKDIYIECNYHWTHGGKLYEGTTNDKLLINKWKKSNSQYYKNAIYIWTDLDLRKYNIAKQNNLNYYIFYNLNDLINWINNFNN